MKRLLLAFAVVAAVSLSACGGSSSSSSEPERDPATYWPALVTERWGDCFTDLGIQAEPVYEANADASRWGFVVVTAPELVLTFSVGVTSGGAEITMPFDDETEKALDPCLYGDDE